MSKEAMKLALEALENAWLDASMGKGDVARHTEAITALRQAIEQAQKQEPVATSTSDLRKMLDIANDADPSRWEIGFRNIVAILYGSRHKFEIKDVVEHVRELSTSPPPRQPLTEEQWQIMADTLDCFITRGQKDIIEAALGIKENT
jgi:hypothetical protein